MSEEDFYVAPLPFQEAIFSNEKKLKIGFYDDDGWFEPVPACKRAVHMAKEGLEAAGHTLVPFLPPRVKEATTFAAAAAVVDGGQYLLNRLRGDLPEPLNAPTAALYTIPRSLRYWLGVIIKPFSYRAGTILTCLPRTTEDLRKVYEGILNYRQVGMYPMQHFKVFGLRVVQPLC